MPAPTSDRWLNAVVSLRVPMDVPLDASQAERDAEVTRIYDALADGDAAVWGAAVGSLRVEEVVDGEPVDGWQD